MSNLYTTGQAPSKPPLSTVFDTPEALRLNKARMEHLFSLDLPLQDFIVLDVGCGVGHLAEYLFPKVHRLTCSDFRRENLDEFKLRHPEMGKPWLWNVCRYWEDFNTPGNRIDPSAFDVTFCYGLLYHLEDPVEGLRNISGVTLRMLLLESQVSDSQLPLVVYEREYNAVANQTIGQFGCRPSSAFIVQTLESCGFKVGIPVSQPEHEDFQWAEQNNLEWQRDGHPLRRVFIARRV